MSAPPAPAPDETAAHETGKTGLLSFFGNAALLIVIGSAIFVFAAVIMLTIPVTWV
ncbi:MAG: hypothetical protein K2X36_07585 [Microbacteriaceae bacterium]|nr:hypothetical protein [Microbacteriaceae bacterium]